MNCSHCGKELDTRCRKMRSRIGRAIKDGLRLFCGIACSGLGRRLQNPPTKAEKIEAKRIYDEQYREAKAEIIRVKKAKYYAENHDREKERIWRKANMHKHVEYCRQPEYKKYKEDYDRKSRARRDYGEFAEAAMLLVNVEKEILSRATRYDIYQMNGILNKSLQRKRALT